MFRYGYLNVFSFFFFSSRRRHTRLQGDWSSDVCSSDLGNKGSYFTVNGTEAVRCSQATSILPLLPVALSVMLRVSTKSTGLPMVMGTRPTSLAGSSVVVPSMLIPHWLRLPAAFINCLLRMSCQFPLSRAT